MTSRTADDKKKLQEQLQELKDIQKDEAIQPEVRNRGVEFYFTEIAPIQIYIQSNISSDTGLPQYTVGQKNQDSSTLRNIPDQKPWLLKRSNFLAKLERPAYARKITDYSELPYFTNEVEYPTKMLYKMEPYEIYDFFFSREFFEYKLDYLIFQKNRGKKPPIDPDTKRREEYNRTNVMTMLQLLLTTVYPRTNNITNSVDEYLRKQSNSLNLSRIMTSPQYTYMSVDGQEYTVMKAIWLNDLFNHPKYNTLADRYIEYKYWCLAQSNTIQKKIEDNMQKIENAISGFDFAELVSILEKRKIPQSGTRALTLEQEVFQTNLESFSVITNIMNAYKMLLLSKKQNLTAFVREVNQYTAAFKPYNGQDVEVCLADYADGDSKYKDYWYYGKINKKDETLGQNSYIVDIYYLDNDKKRPGIQSVELSVDIKYIREPVLPKILELGLKLDGVTISRMEDRGVDFASDNRKDGATYYKNINNTTWNMTRNKDLFKDATSVKLEEYKKSRELYRYKMDQDVYDQLSQQIKRQSGKPITDIFLSYLDTLDDTYTKIRGNLNFNSRIKGFIENVIKLHKIILPIKAIKDLYLKDAKIDIIQKDIAIKDAAVDLTPFKNFATFIGDYLAPNMVSANSDLQAFILAYAENLAGENFITLMDLLETCYSDKKPKCRVIRNTHQREAVLRYVNTSVNYVNINDKSKPQYEIYVAVNFVKGHMDNTNWATIKCDYNDTVLMDRFNGLFNTKQVVGDWIVKPGPFVEVGSAPGAAKPTQNKTKKRGGERKKRQRSRRRR